jgi:hypothetical protein
MFYRGKVAVCFEIHTKNMNALCEQNVLWWYGRWLVEHSQYIGLLSTPSVHTFQERWVMLFCKVEINHGYAYYDV